MAELWALRRFWGPLLGLAALALAIWAAYAGGEHVGKATEQRAEADRHARAVAKVREREVADVAAVAPIHEQVVAEKVRIEWKTQYLTREVVKYVTAKADVQCVVPNGFVSLHDQAAASAGTSVPAAAGGPVDADSGIPLSVVATTVVYNYGLANAYRVEALAWREWYNKVK